MYLSLSSCLSKSLNMTTDEKIIGMTTIINSVSVVYNYRSQGSGFYYSEIAKEATGPIGNNDLAWHKVEGTWLITNRHVAFPSIEQADGTKIETIPECFVFNMREIVNGKIEWVPISLTGDELLKRTKLHPNPQVDVVAINIEDLQTKLFVENQKRTFIDGLRLTNNDLPSSNQPAIEATTDVVIFSYPHGFYDTENKFPIIKSGIVASSWGANFKGNPYFLVDAKLFPGSSGGLVIRKPVNIAIINNKPMYSKDMQYVFLGIYSGEYFYLKNENGKAVKEDYGLGIVWYSYLIPYIINNGVYYSSNNRL